MCILDTEYYYRINNKDKGEERERERITRLLRYNNIVDGSCYIESSIDKFLLETNKFSRRASLLFHQA